MNEIDDEEIKQLTTTVVIKEQTNNLSAIIYKIFDYLQMIHKLDFYTNKDIEILSEVNIYFEYVAKKFFKYKLYGDARIHVRNAIYKIPKQEIDTYRVQRLSKTIPENNWQHIHFHMFVNHLDVENLIHSPNVIIHGNFYSKRAPNIFHDTSDYNTVQLETNRQRLKRITNNLSKIVKLRVYHLDFHRLFDLFNRNGAYFYIDINSFVNNKTHLFKKLSVEKFKEFKLTCEPEIMYNSRTEKFMCLEDIFPNCKFLEAYDCNYFKFSYSRREVVLKSNIERFKQVNFVQKDEEFEKNGSIKSVFYSSKIEHLGFFARFDRRSYIDKLVCNGVRYPNLKMFYCNDISQILRERESSISTVPKGKYHVINPNSITKTIDETVHDIIRGKIDRNVFPIYDNLKDYQFYIEQFDAKKQPDTNISADYYQIINNKSFLIKRNNYIQDIVETNKKQKIN